MARVAVCLALVASAYAALNSGNLDLQTCNNGVGLAGWLRNWDTRYPEYAINCADGNGFSTRGVTRVNTNRITYTVVMRSLGKGITRQGFHLTGCFVSFFDPELGLPSLALLASTEHRNHHADSGLRS